MSERHTRLTMTPDEFLEWQLGVDVKCELIDGEPVAMTGARQRHDVVVVNAISALATRLRGSRCRVSTSDVAIRVPNGNVRRPDIGVICTPLDEDALATTEPTVLIEVLSPSTRPLDHARKRDDYESIASLAQFLLVDPDAAEAVLLSRRDGAWGSTVLTGAEATVDLWSVGVSLPLASFYEGLTLRRRPRLILEDEAPP